MDDQTHFVLNVQYGFAASGVLLLLMYLTFEPTSEILLHINVECLALGKIVFVFMVGWLALVIDRLIG